MSPRVVQIREVEIERDVDGFARCWTEHAVIVNGHEEDRYPDRSEAESLAKAFLAGREEPTVPLAEDWSGVAADVPWQTAGLCTHEIIVRSWSDIDRLYYARCKACGVESHGTTLQLASLAFICEHLR